jgi:HEAT repeat protein
MQALGRIGFEARAAIPALVEALQDPAWQVRREATLALGEMGAGHARPRSAAYNPGG